MRNELLIKRTLGEADLTLVRSLLTPPTSLLRATNDFEGVGITERTGTERRGEPKTKKRKINI